MQNELITLFSRVRVPYEISHNNKINGLLASILNAEISTFGYTFDDSVISRLKNISQNDFMAFRDSVNNTLSIISGKNTTYPVLFKQFPYSVPDKYDHFNRRVIALLGNIFGMQSNQFDILSCGHVIDNRLFDVKEFGACPLCGHQVDELVPESSEVFPFETITPLKVISFADDSFIAKKVSGIIARNSSISIAERKFVRDSKELNLNIIRPTSIFKENIPLVLDLTNDVAYIAKFISGATDVMRIAYFNSNPDSDLSLKENVRFSITTSQKKKIFALLNGCSNIREDMMRNRERWLRLGEKINPGSKDNARRYPMVAAAFDDLRNSPKDIVTFNRSVETKVRAKNVDTALVQTLAQRPGEFVRRLDFILRESNDANEVISALDFISKDLQPKILFELEKYLINRRDSKYTDRIFIPKGQENKVKVFVDTRKNIDATVLSAAIDIIRNQNIKNLSTLNPLGKVYIDPALKNILLPFNRRGDSNTNTSVIKGSRYPLNHPAFVRLFVWWKGNVDVDLSVMTYGDNFNYLNQVSYTNLNDGANMVHSGDITNAPNGASEFIDLNVSKLLAKGVRYIVPSLISYRGEQFETFPCFAGFMERDGLRSGQHYEPESVKIKFDVKSKSNAHCPIIFDLKTDEIIFADISTQMSRHSAVSRNGDRFTTIAKAIVELPNRKPTIYDIIETNAIARGQIVDKQIEADVVFTLDNIDVEEIMSDMIG